jgi:hypothetical protein
MAEKKTKEKTVKKEAKSTSKSKAKSTSKKTKNSTSKSTAKSTKGKKTKNDPTLESGIVIVEDDIEIDQEKVNEERRAYLEESRSQEASD